MRTKYMASVPLSRRLRFKASYFDRVPINVSRCTSLFRNASGYASTGVAAASATSTPRVNPGKFVSGLTSDDIESNREIKDYFNANFGGDDGFGKGGDSAKRGIVISDDVFKEFDYYPIINDVGQDNDKMSNIYSKKPRIDSGLGDAEQQRLNVRVLKTFVRTEEGTRPCNRLREHKSLIPGILFGSDPSLKILSTDPFSKVLLQTPWAEIQRELDRYHRRFDSRVYDITVYDNVDDPEGIVHRVVPTNVQRHPFLGKIYCSNFLRYHPGRPLKIPLSYVNQEESPALKRGGYIIPVNKYIECFVEDGVPFPDSLYVECTDLVAKDVIRIDRIIFPDGISPSNRLNLKDFIVGPVRGVRGAASASESDSNDSEAA